MEFGRSSMDDDEDDKVELQQQQTPEASASASEVASAARSGTTSTETSTATTGANPQQHQPLQLTRHFSDERRRLLRQYYNVEATVTSSVKASSSARTRRQQQQQQQTSQSDSDSDSDSDNDDDDDNDDIVTQLLQAELQHPSLESRPLLRSPAQQTQTQPPHSSTTMWKEQEEESKPRVRGRYYDEDNHNSSNRNRNNNHQSKEIVIPTIPTATKVPISISSSAPSLSALLLAPPSPDLTTSADQNIIESDNNNYHNDDTNDDNENDDDLLDSSSENDDDDEHDLEDEPEPVTILSPLAWNQQFAGMPYHNCMGVVHVQVRQARHLPCPVHSAVQVVLRLHPWKGKVKVQPTALTYASSRSGGAAGGGVCVKFGSHTNSRQAPVTALLHSYAGEEDPNESAMIQSQRLNPEDDTSSIPELQIDLVFHPFALMEFVMCTLRISCQPLLRQPNTCIVAWLQCHENKEEEEDLNQQHQQQPNEQNDAQQPQAKNKPWIQIEAMFEPLVTSEHSDTGDSDSTSTSTTSSTKNDTNVMQSRLVVPRDDPNNDNDGDGSQPIDKQHSQLTSPVSNQDEKNCIIWASLNDNDDDPAKTADSLLLGKERWVGALDAILKSVDNSSNNNDDDGTLEGDDFYDVALEPVARTERRDSTDGGLSGTQKQQQPPPPPLFHQSSPSVSSKSSIRTPRHRKKQPQHLLRLITFRKPAYCCVCGQSITTILWKTIALHCEACGVDCCDDCRLRVDLQLPCMSEEAQQAVTAAFQNKLTIDNLMHAIAPSDYSHESKGDMAMDDVSRRSTTFDLSQRSTTLDIAANKGPLSPHPLLAPKAPPRGVGTMKLEFLRAHVLDEVVAAETDPATLLDRRVRPGEYYVRVSWTGDSKTVRTRTIQSNGRPKLESGWMKFVVPHYGTEFRIELIDATTEKPVGTGLITTQGMLQQQRDYLVEEKRVPFLSFVRPIRFEGTRRLMLELRAGFKSGFSTAEYYTSGKGIASGGDARPGDIAGCIEMNAGFDEDLQGLFGQRPYECPSRPGDELNMGMFQLHLQRISALIQDVKDAADFYKYVVSWQDPLITGGTLLVFVHICVRFDLEYIGSLPLFILLLIMLYLAGKRSFGNIRAKYIQREMEKNRKAENGSISYDIYRPIGHLRLCIVKGRNIRSPELGLPGNVACVIYWNPTRLLDEKLKKRTIDIDGSAGASHEMGSTNYMYAVNPIWERMEESEETKRLKLLMPTEKGAFFDQSAETDRGEMVDFPVLQPLGKRGNLHCLEPWDSSGAAVVVEVKFTDILNIIPGSEYSVGDLAIPFSDVVRDGKISGWFDINISGQEETSTKILKPMSLEEEADESEKISNNDKPQIYVKATWVPPEERRGVVAETVKEASHAIQEELVRAALYSQQQSEKLGIVGSSLGALNSVRGISSNLQMIQNTLGSTLDLCESCIHAFDFTDPFKSMVLLGVIFVIWLVLSLVSTRLIVITIGLVQYAITLKTKIDQWSLSKLNSVAPVTVSAKKPNHEKGEDIPVGTWIANALRGLPTSEDLRRTYFWESRRLGARETESIAAAKRKARMEKLWRVQWYRPVRMLTKNNNKELEWRTVFTIVQGHRILWWRSVSDFDSGATPLGRLFLAGHAGLATPSPLELKRIDPEDVPRVVCIFGRGERTTILTESLDAKKELEKAVEVALSSKQD